MKETRSGRYGRFQARFIDFVISQIPVEQRGDYRAQLIQEVEEYLPEKKRELKDIENFDWRDLHSVAALIKEGWHLMYQAQTSPRAKEAFLEEMAKDLNSK